VQLNTGSALLHVFQCIYMPMCREEADGDCSEVQFVTRFSL